MRVKMLIYSTIGLTEVYWNVKLTQNYDDQKKPPNKYFGSGKSFRNIK